MIKFLLLTILSSLLTHCGFSPDTAKLSEATPIKSIVTLPITGISLDLEEVKTFADLDLNGMIQSLRKNYRAKVLILNYTDNNPEISIGDLRQLNLAEDADAIFFYTEIAKKEKLENEASYLERGESSDLPNTQEGRPYENEDMFLLHLNVERNMLIHEFLHLLISRSDIRQLIAKSHEEKSPHKVLLNSMRGNFDDLQKAYKTYLTIQDQAEKKEASMEDLRNSVRTLILKSLAYASSMEDYSDNTVGEEMDIARFMWEHSEILFRPGGMSKEDYLNRLCVGYYRSKLTEWSKNTDIEGRAISGLVPVFKDAKSAKLLPEEMIQNFTDYIKNFNSVRIDKIKKAVHWQEKK